MDKVKPEFLDRVHYQILRDDVKVVLTGRAGNTSGLDLAWAQGVMMMQKGFGKVPPAREWGLETLFVVDTLTGLGDAAFNWAMFELKVVDGWRATGSGMGLQGDYTQMLVALKCHLIMNSHIRYMGGGGKVAVQNKDFPSAVQYKEVDSNIEGQAYPSALGRILPTQIARHFNMQLEFFLQGSNRRIRTSPKDRMALKCPIQLPDILPQETGMLTIFKEWQKLAKESKT